MSSTGSPVSGRDLETFPEYELTCRYDDDRDPTEVTVFPVRTRNRATEWLTADLSATVSLYRTR